MSRNEGKIGTGDEAAIDAARILTEIELEAVRLTRQAAAARYFSASDGWREASMSLGGAFAPRGSKVEEN